MRGYFDSENLILQFIVIQAAVVIAIVFFLPVFDVVGIGQKEIVIAEDNGAILQYKQQMEGNVSALQAKVGELEDDKELLQKILDNANYSDEMGMVLWFVIIGCVSVFIWRFTSNDKLKERCDEQAKEILMLMDEIKELQQKKGGK